MTHPTIAVIGAGNMGSAIIGGLLQANHPKHNIWTADSDAEKLAQIQKQHGVHITTKNSEAACHAQVIILAVKPQIIADVLHELAPIVQQQQPLLISIAAGIRVESIHALLQGNIAIIRAMPNTPALFGCGATGLYANPYTSAAGRQLTEHIFNTLGISVWLDDEKLLDVVTALSGSGPAYFFLIMEALQQAAEEMGLPGDAARMLTLQTAFGAAKMALTDPASLVDLRTRVTSKGGTTEKAINVLLENNIQELFRKTLQAAKIRSEELGKMIGK